MRNIFTKTLWDYRRSILFWSIGIILMVFMYASLFPSLSGNTQQLTEAFKSLPEGLSAVIGDIGRLGTAEGYMTSEYINLTYPIFLVILGISVGSALIAKEEESGTIELILAAGRSRGQILRQKLVALLGMQAVLGIVSWGAMALGTLMFDIHLSLVRFAFAMLTGWLLGAVFACLALTLTALVNRRGLAVGISTFVFVSTYLLETFGKLVDYLRPYAILSPLHYYDSQNLLYRDPKLLDLLVLAAISGALILIAHFSFDRRDIG
jgi:ABC-2 type transport system permease protein